MILECVIHQPEFSIRVGSDPELPFNSSGLFAYLAAARLSKHLRLLTIDRWTPAAVSDCKCSVLELSLGLFNY